MAAVSSLCLGCGVAIVRGQRANLDCLISYGHIHSGDAGYMCRKCLYAYEKIATGLEMAESKAISAFVACVLYSYF